MNALTFYKLRKFVGKTVLPVAVFALLLPAVGVLRISGGITLTLFAGAVFAALTYGLKKAAERYIGEPNGSSVRKVLAAFAIVITINALSILTVSAVFPTVAIASLGALAAALIAAVLYPFLEQLVIGYPPQKR